MSTLEIHQIPTCQDNYVYLLRADEGRAVGVIDPSDAGPFIDTLEAKGWTLTHILNTHHHNDHAGGNAELEEKYGCTVVGARVDRERIPGIDVEVDDGDNYGLGDAEAKVFFIPGHTLGHIAYWFPELNALFCGDTIFAIGCGRLSEGSADQLWASLSRLRELPDETRIYCAHEYTQANARFALTIEVDNTALRDQSESVDAMRTKGLTTVPSPWGRNGRPIRSCAPTPNRWRGRSGFPAPPRSRCSPKSAVETTISANCRQCV